MRYFMCLEQNQQSTQLGSQLQQQDKILLTQCTRGTISSHQYIVLPEGVSVHQKDWLLDGHVIPRYVFIHCET